VSAQQRTIFRVVRNLARVNGVVAGALIAYAHAIGLGPAEFARLALIAVLATVPVALPATFTLATALGARALARQGVLPTRLSAVDEAATMTVLCSDKTGTLTRNELAVTAVRAMPGFDEARVLALAALASSEGGRDPIDDAIAKAAAGTHGDRPERLELIPFDPATKRAEAWLIEAGGERLRVIKGAFAVVAGLCRPSPGAERSARDLELEGHRVLGVAFGPPRELRLAGLIALSDPPRSDAAPCIAQLRRLGVDVVIVTGDAPATAEVVARAVGVIGAVHPLGSIESDVRPNQFAVYAGVLPEDKFKLVGAFQKEGYTVGMCGDGANDAPALRQAQIGIAVSTATDVAKSAAGIILIEPGLAGIVSAVREGRTTFQRILTYTLRSIVHKVRQVLFLAIGLVMTGHAILTPMMVALSMITSDFFAMSVTTDNVEPSPEPNTWRIDSLTLAGALMGLVDLAFCVAVLAVSASRSMPCRP
jgi:H+-transporting ATPase